MSDIICTFCSIKIYPGHGSLFVKNNLKLHFFCRSKCRKLFNLKKNPLFLPWTISNRINRGVVLIPEIKKPIFPLKIPRTLKSYNELLVSRLIFSLKREELLIQKKKHDFKYNRKKNLKWLRDRVV